MIDIIITCPTGEAASTEIKLNDGTPVLGCSGVILKIEPMKPTVAELSFCNVGVSSHAKADLSALVMRIYEQGDTEERAAIKAQIRRIDEIDAERFDPDEWADKAGRDQSAPPLPKGAVLNRDGSATMESIPDLS